MVETGRTYTDWGRGDCVAVVVVNVIGMVIGDVTLGEGLKDSSVSSAC